MLEILIAGAPQNQNMLAQTWLSRRLVARGTSITGGARQ
jgi:hypothetical protein